MNAVQQLIEQVEKRCKENGVRLTDKRKRALSILIKSGKALSAYELVEAYKTELGDTLPAMSMYRILEFLVNEHLVHRLELANKFVACENIHCKTERSRLLILICGQCQRVKELTVNKSVMETLKDNVNGAGYRLASQQLELKCTCVKCADKAI